MLNFVADQGHPLHGTCMAVLEAARHVDPDFKVVLSPDCVCHWRAREKKRFIDFYKRLTNHPSVFRLDGKPVLSPWGAHVHPPEFWRQLVDAVAAEGLDMAFVPCPHGTGGG